MAAVHDYERLGTIGQANLTIQKRHVYDKLTSKFKNKVIIVEDWIDIFDLVDGLLLHCSEILQTGWQKDGLTDFFTKLVHPVIVHARLMKLILHTAGKSARHPEAWAAPAAALH